MKTTIAGFTTSVPVGGDPDAFAMAGWLSQRRAVLALLLIEAAIAWTGTIYYLLVDNPVTPASRPAFIGLSPVITVLALLYWRGWDTARYLG
jgi:hypothetical protein